MESRENSYWFLFHEYKAEILCREDNVKKTKHQKGLREKPEVRAERNIHIQRL